MIRPSLALLSTLFMVSGLAEGASRLINGKPVEPGTWREVVRISSSGSGCTATVVGPRVIVTAAHCASNGATATFKIGEIEYKAKITRSPLYTSKDHDIAVGITDTDIAGIEPASIGGKAVTGLGITLLGYGCINPGGGGGNDGILRIGDTVITGFSGFDMVSRKAGGAALCFGDSGGPAMLIESGKHLLVGVNSKGNIVDTNYNSRSDVPESQTFLKDVATQSGVQICGINKDCSGTPPPPPKPTCTLSANPSTVNLGSSLVLSLITQGQVTGASIEGTDASFPTGSKTITPSAVGTFTANATVTGPGGSNTCSASYTVKNDPLPPVKPTCTLTAQPDTIKLGETITLEMATNGQVTSASIDGTDVAFPMGKKLITPTAKGSFTANATVTGPGGTNSCWAGYVVEDGGPGPDPSTPNFAVVAAYCGDNVVLETKVSRVCLAVVKKDSSILDLKMNQVLLVTYQDSTKEVMPIIHRVGRPKVAGDLQQREDLKMYANTTVAADKYLVLDTRDAVLTKAPARDGEVPKSIQGRTAKGNFFLVENLQPYSVGF